MKFDKLIRKNILGLEPYRCARDDYKVGVLLDANENTHGPALEKVSEEEEFLSLNRYPDPHQLELKEQIVKFRNEKPNKYLKDPKDQLTVDNLCLGVGSDESIDMLLRCTCTPGKDKLLICPPTYGMYSICAAMNDVELVKVPLKAQDFQLDVPAIVEQVKSDANIKLAYLTSPGNPTGKLLAVEDVVQLLQLLESETVAVIVDEAYIDFSASADERYSESMSTLVNQFQNLVVMQTLSKSFGLAGIRLGITYSPKQLSHCLNSMKYPYNISSLTSAVALRATGPGLKTMQQYVDSIIKQRDMLVQELQQIDGVGENIGGLDSNFILIQFLDKDGKPSNEVAQKLYKWLATNEQVVVRFRGTELNCTGALRISVGTAEENQILLQKIKATLPGIRG